MTIWPMKGCTPPVQLRGDTFFNASGCNQPLAVDQMVEQVHWISCQFQLAILNPEAKVTFIDSGVGKSLLKKKKKV